jgi:hypothetical protein
MWVEYSKKVIDTYDKIFDDVEEYSTNMSMDEKRMNFILNVTNKCYFSRKLN